MELGQQSCLVLDASSLLQIRAPLQESLDGFLAARLGLGHCESQNLALRRALGKPGHPFGGIGFFEWTEDLEQELLESAITTVRHVQKNNCHPGAHDLPQTVIGLKLQEFARCADGDPSFYFWALHPIFNSDGCAVGAEVLLRAKNGVDTAPFDDVHALMDPAAPAKIKGLYAKWVGAQIVNFPMQVLKDFPALRRLQFISVNVRPSDLSTNSLTFHDVTKRLRGLPDEDRRLLVSMVCIEICEDQEDPPDMETSLAAWQQLGFRCAYDDTISKLTCQAIGKPSENFHTPENLEPLLKYFWLVKIDIDWAGHIIFLCHPRLGEARVRKAHVLWRARSEGLVYVAEGRSSIRNTGVKHADALAEFAAFAQHVIRSGTKICFELSVNRDDCNVDFALAGLREFGIDIFGKHSAHFCFQGGVFGPKAFLPSQLAEHCM